MVADNFIAARVSSETKARLKALAARRQLSESALLKDLLELTLSGAAVPELEDAERVCTVARAARLYVRLRTDDQLLLAERAAARRMAAATYVSVLVRAHLRRLTPLPKDELLALNRSVAVSKVQGPEAALAMIAPLEPRLSGYFHFFGTKGALLLQLARHEEARTAFDHAIALANTPAEAAHIRQHLDRLQRENVPPAACHSRESGNPVSAAAKR